LKLVCWFESVLPVGFPHGAARTISKKSGFPTESKWQDAYHCFQAIAVPLFVRANRSAVGLPEPPKPRERSVKNANRRKALPALQEAKRARVAQGIGAMATKPLCSNRSQSPHDRLARRLLHQRLVFTGTTDPTARGVAGGGASLVYLRPGHLLSDPISANHEAVRCKN
jgi:hypothetical protein